MELIQNDGSPSGSKLFVLWNPPLRLKMVCSVVKSYSSRVFNGKLFSFIWGTSIVQISKRIKSGIDDDSVDKHLIARRSRFKACPAFCLLRIGYRSHLVLSEYILYRACIPPPPTHPHPTHKLGHPRYIRKEGSAVSFLNIQEYIPGYILQSVTNLLRNRKI